MSAHGRRFAAFGMGMALARLLSAACQIVLGRGLGPAGYGELTLVVLLAGYLVLPAAGGWGLAFIKQAAGETDPAAVASALKALLIVSAVAALTVSLATLLLQNPLGAWLNMPAQHVRLALLIALASGAWTLAKQAAQAGLAWGRYVRIEVAGSATTLMLVLVLLETVPTRVTPIAVAFAAAYLTASLIGLCPLVSGLRGMRGPASLRALVSRGTLLALSTILATAAFGIDRLLIGSSLDAVQVGLYQAHFLATYGVVGALMTIVITYVFPLFCRNDERRLARLLPTVCLWQYPLTLLGSALLGYLILRLYAYPLQPQLFASLCAFNAAEVHLQLRAYYLAGRTLAATRFMLASQLVFLLVNIAVLTALMDRVGILAGGLALLASALAALLFLRVFQNTLAGMARKGDSRAVTKIR